MCYNICRKYYYKHYSIACGEYKKFMKKKRDFRQEKNLYEAGVLLLLMGILLVSTKRILAVNFALPPCLFHKWTGYYCPGCGGTRAVKALLRGDVIRSFFYHPVVLYGAVLYSWYMISHTIEYLSKGKFRISMPYREVYLYIAVVVILVQCVLKNVVKIIWGINLI